MFVSYIIYYYFLFIYYFNLLRLQMFDSNKGTKVWHIVFTGNAKKTYRGKGLITPRLKSKSCSSNVEATSRRSLPFDLLIQTPDDDLIDIDAELNWLKYNSKPVELVKKKWKLTSNVRLQTFFKEKSQRLDEYVEVYKCLKKSFADQLVCTCVKWN